MAQRLVMTEAIHMGTHHRKRRGRVVEIACVIRWVQYVEYQRMYVVPSGLHSHCAPRATLLRKTSNVHTILQT